MSNFDDLANLYETQNKDQIQNVLFEMIENVLKSPSIIVEESDPSGDETKLVYRPIVLDRSWMADKSAALASRQYTRLRASIKNLGIHGITDISTWIEEMNSFLTDPIDVTNHTKSLARVDILRTFYHLLTGPNEQSKGYDFEQFLALLFGGKVVPVNSELGVADVVFPGAAISAKFLRPSGEIKGSLADVERTISATGTERTSGRAIYLVGLKGAGVVRFYMFEIDAESLQKIKDDGKVDSKGMQMQFNTRYVENNPIFKYHDLPDLDLRRCLEVTTNVFEALNDKFKNLFKQLQDLVREVDDLMYKSTDSKSTKSSASAAATKAGTVRDTSTGIEGSID
jgi:hypothetical protein